MGPSDAAWKGAGGIVPFFCATSLSTAAFLWRHIAVRVAKADRGHILMSTLVGEQMNPKQPIHIIISVDGNERGEKSVALIATQIPVGLTDPVTVQVFAHAERELGH